MPNREAKIEINGNGFFRNASESVDERFIRDFARLLFQVCSHIFLQLGIVKLVEFLFFHEISHAKTDKSDN